LSPKLDRPAAVDTATGFRYQWQREAETAKFIEEGKERYQQARGAIGASCDMCHPHAANTHPESDRKYETQLQRVALLRDTINWCIENPVEGNPLRPDDPRLRALEAYIIAQHNGTALAFGKHTDCEQNSIAAFGSSHLQPARRC
jgi:thiosulfate dehydrogenase